MTDPQVSDALPGAGPRALGGFGRLVSTTVPALAPVEDAAPWQLARAVTGVKDDIVTEKGQRA